MFKDILDDIVLEQQKIYVSISSMGDITYPKLILHQVRSAVVEFVHERLHSFFWEVFEAPLEYPATVGVGRKFKNISAEYLNKFKAVWRYSFD